MPRGDKSSYSNKQKRQAEHIEEGYEQRGVSHEEAERRAWATVNAETGGGKKSGSGRGRRVNRAPSRKRFFMREANTGCPSVGLAPMTMMTSACSTESNACVPAEVPKVVFRP